ncbi:helix-turn-helix domain-containing protein [Methylobacterium sp. WL12]|nr:helix-turn-helix domain-containing protein [Methylobacterium sp. WL12]TXM66856.1 helix-turn-helix domain-containing protein [Methylobacterium sp. WL120]TXN15776.1 helix-turn-helix domain-containing protein [Methylobacterium sp. WL122]TXN83007.1 helix-turn-helix domain-containing protein [Methylobacterium sp. WL8]
MKSGKPTIDADRARKLAASDMGGTAIARALNVSRASVYRLLNPSAGEATLRTPVEPM